jgi:hypothetical protein
MQDDQLDVDVRPRKPYPWARALLILVLYVSLLLFLWHFPIPAVRTFFRNLVEGFAYVIAGVALIGLTVGAFFLIPPPFVARGVDEQEEASTEDAAARCARFGRVLMVPALTDVRQRPEILDLLGDLVFELDSTGAFVVDEKAGAVTVVGDTNEDIETLLDEAQTRLLEAGLRARLPH